MGWEVVRHAAGMIWRNLGPALRVTVGPGLLGGMLLGILLTFAVAVVASDGPRLLVVLAGAAMLAALLVTFAWSAVAWHRFVLLEEPAGVFPPFDWTRVGPYAGRSLLLGLMVGIAVLPLAYLGTQVLGPGSGTEVVLSLSLGVLAGWALTRLSLALPAAAVGRRLSFGESWQATAPASGAVLVTALALVGLNLAVTLPVLGRPPGDPLSLAVSIAGGWVTGMLGLSVLTTLYGHLVERRPLA